MRQIDLPGILLLAGLSACVPANSPSPTSPVPLPSAQTIGPGSPNPAASPSEIQAAAQTLSPFYLPRLGSRNLLYGEGELDTAPLPTPAPASQPSPVPTLPPSTGDISTIEKTTFNGWVLDDQGRRLAGVRVQVRSLNSSVVFFEETLTDENGAYGFNNAPAGVNIEIVISGEGYATRRRVEVLKSNKQGDPNANKYDFGDVSPTEPTPSPSVSSPSPFASAVPPLSPPTSLMAERFSFRQSQAGSLSFDGSASLSLLSQIQQSLNQNQRPPLRLARPWDALQLENLSTANSVNLGPFQVSMGLRPGTQQQYDWGARVTVPAVSREQRPPVVLTVLVEHSALLQQSRAYAQQSPPSLSELIQQGLQTLEAELKAGDRINLVLFGDSVHTLLAGQTFSGGQPLSQALNQAIAAPDKLPGQSLPAGLAAAYALAQTHFQAGASNRVLLLGTGIVPAEQQAAADALGALAASQAQNGIGLSVVATGTRLHEARLHTLQAQGRGSLQRLESSSDLNRVFSQLLPGLLNPTVRHLQVRLELPAGLTVLGSSSEISTASGTAWQGSLLPGAQQGFWQRFSASSLPDNALFRLHLSYLDGQNQLQTQVHERSVSLLKQQYQSGVRDLRLISLLYQGLRTQVSPAQAAQELEQDFADHNTALANTYKSLIQQWRSLP